MDILTKICVVILLVLVLVSVPVFIAQATVPANYRYLYQQERQRSELNAQQAKNAELMLQRVQQQAQASQGDLNGQIAELQRRLGGVREELADEKLKNAKLQTQLDSLDSRLLVLAKANEQHAARNQSLVQTVESLQDNLDELNRENTRLATSERQLMAENERVEQISKARIEQITDLKETVSRLEQQIETVQSGGTISRGPSTAVGTDVEITGTVSAVEPATSTASVNVGSAQGVAKGMELVIYRGSKFVGYLRIVDVELNQAAGIITNQQAEPRQGDKVATRATLNR